MTSSSVIAAAKTYALSRVSALGRNRCDVLPGWRAKLQFGRLLHFRHCLLPLRSAAPHRLKHMATAPRHYGRHFRRGYTRGVTKHTHASFLTGQQLSRLPSGEFSRRPQNFNGAELRRRGCQRQKARRSWSLPGHAKQ